MAGVLFDPLSSSPTEWSNTLKQFVGKVPTNCLSLFDHFVGLALKGLSYLKTDTSAFLKRSTTDIFLGIYRNQICFKGSLTFRIQNTYDIHTVI